MYSRWGKRALDVVLSAAALVVLSPLMLVVAVLVRANLGTPVLFRQMRPGRDGKLFQLYKFRTMTGARDASGQLLPDEDRLSAFGACLRAASLDELPQLWNILRGDMSFVGPRPLLAEYLPLYSADQRRRHEVRPGLTGLAQIHGRNALSWEERFAWDTRYVEHITFRGDCAILWETVGLVLRREGIRSRSAATMEPFRGNRE